MLSSFVDRLYFTIFKTSSWKIRTAAPAAQMEEMALVFGDEWQLGDSSGDLAGTVVEQRIFLTSTPPQLSGVQSEIIASTSRDAL